VDHGAPRAKLLMGLPAYGRRFVLADPANNGVGAAITDGGDMPYYEV